MKRRAPSGLFEPAQLVRTFPEALRKLRPRVLVKNPVLSVPASEPGVRPSGRRPTDTP